MLPSACIRSLATRSTDKSLATIQKEKMHTVRSPPSQSPAPSHFDTDMRKALPRDVHKKSIIPLPHPVYPSELD